MGLIVITGRVDVETNVGPGRARKDFYRDQPLPDDITAEDRERVLRMGWAVEAEEEAPADSSAFDPATLGQATIEATLTWVGDDKARALRALDAETADGGKNRPTAIAALNAIIGKE